MSCPADCAPRAAPATLVRKIAKFFSLESLYILANATFLRRPSVHGVFSQIPSPGQRYVFFQAGEHVYGSWMIALRVSGGFRIRPSTGIHSLELRELVVTPDTKQGTVYIGSLRPTALIRPLAFTSLAKECWQTRHVA